MEMVKTEKTSKRKKESESEELKKKKKKKKTLSEENTVTSRDSPQSDIKKEKKRKREVAESNSVPTKKSKKENKVKNEPEELEIDISAPTPPSKKALRLQKKGKPVPPLPSTSQPPTNIASKTPVDEQNVHPDRKKLVKEEPRAEWSVWIGNLAYKSDVRSLRGWLVRGDQRVTDKEITRIHLPLNADGQSKGFAYVDFTSKEAMEKVISRSEEAFDGRRLLIKNAKSFEGRPAQTKQRYQVQKTKPLEINTVGNGTPDTEKIPDVEEPSQLKNEGAPETKEKARKKEKKTKTAKVSERKPSQAKVE